MLQTSRRRWRLFYFPLGCVCLALAADAVAQGPTLTTVSDNVYRADGSPASGTLLISWPAFTTGSGATVAAGNTNVALGTNGSFSAQLAPNAGATPAGTVYTVTYQLTDGTVKTENWSIGTISPETISQVRTLAGTTTQLAQAATQQYVNAQLATVVHLSGAETITGAKQFAVSPSLPTPSQSGDAVNKAYVDSAVSNSGSGSFVSKAGDTMTGPLTLPADPTAPLQATDKHYIDLIAASKAAMPGAFDLSPIQNLDTLPYYLPDPQKTWSQHAGEISLLARGSYRVLNGSVLLAPIGAVGYTLNESDSNFCPQGLMLQPGNAIVNDVTVLGNLEPRAYVRDYFVGNGVSTRFYLSQPPFTKSSTTIFDEEFGDATLDPTRWNIADPAHAIVAGSGKLQIAGGTGADGATTVTFVEQMEMGGAWVMEHGDVVFTSNVSSGIIGGLYLGGISAANCLAGFQISPSGSVSQIQALINGAAAGSALLTVSGRHYVLTTRIYSQEIFRLQQTFHCAASPAGAGIGGAQLSADVRLVLEVHDIDPTNPATMVAPATILYDGVISGAPAFCTYALVNSPSLYCAIAFTRLIQAPDVEVRTSLPGQPYVSRLVGPLSSGCECNVISGTTLDFFSAYVPATNQYIEVHYRGQYGSDSLLATVGRAMARVTNPAGISAQQRGIDNGVRSAVRHVKSPPARTSADCENAALAVLSDGASAGWTGRYETWSDFLPGAAQDIFPGDALAVNVPSCSANFQAIVREVEITVQDLFGEHSRYKIQFADDAAKTLSFELEAAKVSTPLSVDAITNAHVGSTTLADLTSAQITAVASTTASIDAGIPPQTGGAIEVRWSDQGWGQFNDENLAGRFTTQAFTLPRLTKVEDYFLRQYDSVPPKYSRHSAALHIDYPF